MDQEADPQNQRHGQLQTRELRDDSDLQAAFDLRALCFRNGERDTDPLDSQCRHFGVFTDDDILCTFRTLEFHDGKDLNQSYAAQFYDLHGLASFDQPLLELGRFCIRPGALEPDVMRCAWACLTDRVLQGGFGFLFGCTSFEGVDVTNHDNAFGLLARDHLAPSRWRPGHKVDHIVPLQNVVTADRRKALMQLPPLLRSYLRMGAKVSDHAVLDHDLKTTHVFTGLEVASVPAARFRALQLLSRSVGATQSGVDLRS